MCIRDRAAAALVATQLDDSNARSGELESSLNATRDELDGAQGRIADLEAQLNANSGDLDDRDARIAELEGELGAALAVRNDLDAANNRITELEAALDGEDEEDVANAEVNAAHVAAFASGAWMVGQTTLGTAGVEPDHVDDLKKIKGIGPKLEGVLNEKGVQTYEQLAVLTDDEQEIVNGALDAFPGRIYRDEWVPQAQAIMANGHAPLTKAKKADLESANARIDELEGDLADASSAGDRVGELEAELAAAQALQGDLDGANAQIATLGSELDSAKAIQGDLDARNARVAELEAELAAAQGLQGEIDARNERIAALEGDLGKAQALQGEVDARNKRIAELQSALGKAENLQGDVDARNKRIAELEAELKALSGTGAEVGQLRVAITEKDRRIEALETAARGAASSDELAKAKATIEKRNARIKELEAAQADLPDDARHFAAWKSGAWKSGKTKLSTPGIDHSDDLKVISGIGPQMEELLNGFGIKSWEQLSDLNAEQIATVDAALEDFPGRITRDEWVPQAIAIMKNGHQPVKRAPKPRPKPSWQKGTTKLGTPGAGHSDDLKVINGIGPKMEGILNSFGIKAWEQLAALKKGEVENVNNALDFFPGRIERDDWVGQAKGLCKQFPDTKKRPTRKTYLNNSGDADPFN